jgi:hypothetical protein
MARSVHVHSGLGDCALRNRGTKELLVVRFARKHRRRVSVRELEMDYVSRSTVRWKNKRKKSSNTKEISRVIKSQARRSARSRVKHQISSTEHASRLHLCDKPDSKQVIPAYIPNPSKTSQSTPNRHSSRSTEATSLLQYKSSRSQPASSTILDNQILRPGSEAGDQAST